MTIFLFSICQNTSADIIRKTWSSLNRQRWVLQQAAVTSCTMSRQAHNSMSQFYSVTVHSLLYPINFVHRRKYTSSESSMILRILFGNIISESFIHSVVLTPLTILVAADTPGRNNCVKGVLITDWETHLEQVSWHGYIVRCVICSSCWLKKFSTIRMSLWIFSEQTLS